MSQFVVKLAVLLSLLRGLKVILDSLRRVTCLPLGSPVVSLWTDMFCSISSADDVTIIRLLLGPQQFVS